MKKTIFVLSVVVLFMFCETANAANSCKATAYPTVGNVGGVAWNDDKNIAEKLAISYCWKNNGGAGTQVAKTCRITESICSKK